MAEEEKRTIQTVPRPFFDLNTMSPQSTLTLDIMSRAVKGTYGPRHAKVDAIRLEVKILVDALARLVDAEKTYHGRMGLFSDVNASDPYASTSAPECRPANKGSIVKSMAYKDPRQEVKDSPIYPSSVPAVSVGIIKMLDLLDEVERDIRLYSHRVKSARLQIQVKLLELDRLMAETEKTADQITSVVGS